VSSAREAVVRHVGARGKNAGIVVARLPRGTFVKPRLRFDRVVLSLTRRLQEALADAVPEGRTVLVTVTAPIRLAAKTAEALEAAIRAGLARRAALDLADTVHGNRVRARLVKGGSGVIVFVHNPETDAQALLDRAQTLLAATARHAGEPESWLVLDDADGLAYLEVYRHICAGTAGFAKIFGVFAGGRVETIL
jgi:uncharacterized membrane protein